MSIPESKGGAGPSTSASRQSSLSTGSYVPPHLRRAANTPTPSSSRHGFRDADATPSPTHPRARWSQTNSRSDPSPRDRPARLDLGSWSSPSPRGTPGSWASSPNDRDRFRSSPGLSSSGSSRNWSKYPPTSHLFISGDSFVGALSPALGPKEEEVDLRDPEQMEEMRIARRIKRVVIDKGKGAAAKVRLSRSRLHGARLTTQRVGPQQPQLEKGPSTKSAVFRQRRVPRSARLLSRSSLLHAHVREREFLLDTLHRPIGQ